MASLASGLRHVKCSGQLTRCAFQRGLAMRPKTTPKINTRQLNTSQLPSAQNDAVSQIKIPFEGVQNARHLPATPSYFSREPTFNDLHIRLFNMLTKYHDLPMVKPADAPQIPWLKLDVVRHQTGEPIKAAHFAKVMQVAKRLNLIEPSLRPAEIDEALKLLSRPVESTMNHRRPLVVDKHGRAVGVGRRKVSTARAFVVEGTGEVLVNGKSLSDAFGRVHDRESAIWALTSTNRLDKYNVWAIVRGGGTTGQAEALTMAIANGLVAHEPALKTALRQAGCITRDPRMVERKKHGRVKARKSPAWVKR
ncbi:37S ribosomal protein-like protein [Hapsidospora chrysogenum ATCC 11550]|uniref:Small ribosomal subunit protein uS9m n=1 Tax=Hapsidospora chrysogenum (strain ATCC 11550 / CBS 779.69 / DSM 880 / IAM 14645 / JCM 23072 / IMI 49137) TaxID=857340 RepID=A0A086SW56_HAPC1|nr:37S ribosomal protein-like protein [Hapsidospora chrysogenum ATCC 11550]